MCRRVISKEEARKFLIQYHNLDDSQKFEGIDGVLDYFNRVGSIQYDPLNVVGRNADLVLQAKVKGYQSNHLETLLYKDYKLVDGFDKEMCIYQIEDYNNFQRVREATARATKCVLSNRNQLEAFEYLEVVKEHINTHGITSTKDISIGESSTSRWGHKKLSSATLDYLYSSGELFVVNKKGVQKYFDLTENVLSKEFLNKDKMKSDEEFLKWYIKRRIRSVGFLWDKRGGAWQGHYISDRKTRTEVLSNLVSEGELIAFHIEGIDETFYMVAEDERFFNQPPAKKQVKFLAPLDNMLWDRDLVSTLFDFDYRWEVYTPVIKRKYGYYVLPVLYGDKLVARFEPERVSYSEVFTIKNWWWEDTITITEELIEEVHSAIQRFANYLDIPCKDSYTEILLKR
ncbi:DNA glycosylase AlkZ-like family protein [Lachnoclostridium phytofermentans]|uniref:Winged helix-turn-helix domain-containing protein n=1 Tax=Lachnoclostridium phytofermentans (strain ATCC 700394 / DSM 18823 / ISDg) TaxID=357809 RepID=A9KT24_LACP7|nr:winged helix DNA-binding domain-containing protein [Lachnoclostridium phytofermentans]ABX42235.1 conserved hypothetical protein [Lachnoclostridium phytofermentans ISDg]